MTQLRVAMAAALASILTPILVAPPFVGATPSSTGPNASLLMSGLEGSYGSTVGPGGDLYVVEGAARRVSRVDPKTGTVTTFASGLPARVVPGAGGATDVEFIGKTGYVLVQFIGTYLGGPDEVNGIYRVDGPNTFTVVADIGAFNVANPPDTDFELPTGVQTSFHAFRGGFLVTDGHLNRMLFVIATATSRWSGPSTTSCRWGSKPGATGSTWRKPVRFLTYPRTARSFRSPQASPTTEVAAGGPLLVDVERGRGTTLYGLAQGIWPPGTFAGNPALPNTGQLLRVNNDGTFRVIAGGLNQPSSMEIIKNTAYIVTLGGEIWKIEDIS